MKKLLVEIEFGFDETCTLEDMKLRKSYFRTDLKECISGNVTECEGIVSFKISETILDSNGDVLEG